MKSIKNLSKYPSGSVLISDEIVEFHASRLLLLIDICGKKDRNFNLKRIEGFTKLAKLDFFIRYPEFFLRAVKDKDELLKIENIEQESKMIRFHYGPFDKRYYHIIPYLISKGCVKITNKNNRYDFYITDIGMQITDELKTIHSFDELIFNISKVNDIFGSYSGTKLKEMVYDLFDEEVAQKKLGDLIK